VGDLVAEFLRVSELVGAGIEIAAEEGCGPGWRVRIGHENRDRVL
jgi:hypothetical protein